MVRHQIGESDQMESGVLTTASSQRSRDRWVVAAWPPDRNSTERGKPSAYDVHSQRSVRCLSGRPRWRLKHATCRLAGFRRKAACYPQMAASDSSANQRKGTAARETPQPQPLRLLALLVGETSAADPWFSHFLGIAAAILESVGYPNVFADATSESAKFTHSSRHMYHMGLVRCSDAAPLGLSASQPAIAGQSPDFASVSQRSSADRCTSDGPGFVPPIFPC